MNDSEKIEMKPEWAADYESAPKAFKLLDGDTKTVMFLDSGKKHHDRKNDKDDIVFMVESEGQKMSWYVNTKSYSVLADIRDIGFPLNGKTITVSRKGSKRFDTRYTIVLNK